MGDGGSTNSGLGLGMGMAIGTAINAATSVMNSMQYLVEGAKLVCVNGSSITQLKVPEGHSYTSGGKKKANCKDCKVCDNITYFGKCNLDEENHKCEGFIDLADKWENTAVSTTKAEDVSGEEAINMSSVLLCKRGGIIIPVSSGQGYDGKVDWDNFLKRYQDIVRWAAGKDLLNHVYRKDPININTGNYIYEKVDLFIDGDMPLLFRLFYNAMDCGEQEALGEGWNHNYGIYLKKVIGDELLEIIFEDGRQVPYRRELEHKYVPIMGDTGILKESDFGYVYEQSNLVFEFDHDGRLLRQKDLNGNSRLFKYNMQGLLISAESSSGGLLYYSYNKKKRLISVADHTGRKVKIGYQYGKIRWFTNSAGERYTYEYNENGILHEIITPREIAGVKNEYDGANRVLKQTLPDGSVVELRYDDKNNRTYMKEQNGNLIVYESDAKMRNIRTIYEDGEETFVYNDRNLPIRYTDKNGNTTLNSYDSRGNLIQVINALREKFSMTYDSKNCLLSLKLPDNSHIRFHYDSHGKLIEITNQLGASYKALYNNNGKIACAIQPDGSHVQFSYDSRGNVINEKDSLGNCISCEYNELNQVTKMTDAKQNITQYSYNSNGDVIEIINAMGRKKTFAYNKSGKIIAMKDFDGTTQRIEYDDCNMPYKYIDAENNSTCFQYNEMGKLVKITYPNGGEAKYEYDRFDHLKSYTDVIGASVCYDYDAMGNLTKIIGPREECTKFAYDALNRRISIHEPDDNIVLYEYNSQGNITKIRDTSGNNITYEYDLCGRKIKEVDNIGNTTTYTYDCMDNLIQVMDGAGRVTSYSYCSSGLIESSIFPDGTSEHYLYDENKNLKEIENQAGYMLHYSYDELNRLTQISSSKNQYIYLAYDAVNRLISKKDANGAVTRYEYSLNGNLSSIDDVFGNKTLYQYDCIGNLSAVFMPGNKNEEQLGIEEAIKLNLRNKNLHLTLFERDLLGRIKTVVDALGNKESYEYDKVGNIIKKCDKEGYETEYEYNILNQMSSINYNNEKRVEFFYDKSRNLKEMRDWLGITSIKSDAFGRVSDITDYRGKKVSYEFGMMGERKAIIYSDGDRVKYSYDDCLRISSLTYKNKKIKYHYNKNGCLSQKEYMSGLVSNYSYDEAGFLTGFSHENSHGILDQCEYSYDKMGNKLSANKYRKGLKEDNGEFLYEYDTAARLIGIKNNGKILHEYKYDTFGNRCYSRVKNDTPITNTYNALNQLISESGNINKQYLYDNRGNLNHILENGEETETYVFGILNKLEKITTKIGNNTVYGYNGLGGRTFSENYTEKNSISQIKKFTLDMTSGDHNYIEMEENNSKYKYIWDNELVGTDNGKSNQFFFLDDLGSPIRLLYSNGQVSQSYAYDEFGNCYSFPDGRIQPFGYTGYIDDNNSRSLYAYAREYKPEMGRFISEDIIRGNIFAPYTQNCYSYCFNNPLNYVDINGAWPKWVNNAGKWIDKHKKGLVTAGACIATAVVVVVAAPALAAAGVTVGAAAGVMAVGAVVGGGIDAAVQGYEIYTGKREKFNGLELIINAATGAGAAITGPSGAGVMAAVNYAGTQIVNDEKPTLGGLAISYGLGSLGGWIAGKAFTKAGQIALSRGAVSVTDAVSIIAGKVVIHGSINSFAKAAFTETTIKMLMSGVFKSLISTNPWVSSFLIEKYEKIIKAMEDRQFVNLANASLCTAAQ